MPPFVDLSLIELCFGPAATTYFNSTVRLQDGGKMIGLMEDVAKMHENLATYDRSPRTSYNDYIPFVVSAAKLLEGFLIHLLGKADQSFSPDQEKLGNKLDQLISSSKYQEVCIASLSQPKAVPAHITKRDLVALAQLYEARRNKPLHFMETPIPNIAQAREHVSVIASTVNTYTTRYLYLVK
ncbi:MAG: hypothetical protein QG626_201 [Patescibacteria group bacterium]|jgi:rhamnose utilization protein RhaD (predicted bifunctional aldolase and dehydrogenase)|nr:hypothetical protein [Patescibacteria group bacterium]